MKYSIAVCALLGMITKEQVVKALRAEDVIGEDALVNIDEEQLKDEEYLALVSQLNGEHEDDTLVELTSDEDQMVEIDSASESMSDEMSESDEGMDRESESDTESEADEVQDPKA